MPEPIRELYYKTTIIGLTSLYFTFDEFFTMILF